MVAGVGEQGDPRGEGQQLHEAGLAGLGQIGEEPERVNPQNSSRPAGSVRTSALTVLARALRSPRHTSTLLRPSPQREQGVTLTMHEVVSRLKARRSSSP